MEAAYRDDSGGVVRSDLGLAYAWAGRREEAEKLASAGAANALAQARVYAGLGDQDRFSRL